jgi:hypothetical protein
VSDYDRYMGREDHDLDRAQDHVDREEWALQQACEHLHVDVYTIRDWRETGIPAGAVCSDCGKQLPEPDEIEYPESQTERTAP